MKKVMCFLMLTFCGGCLHWWAGEREGQAVGGGAFMSPAHQESDFGFVRTEGESKEHTRGISFQFPSLGIYGGNDHTSIGALLGFTIFYGKDKHLKND